jgi:hypothetical protein
MAMRLLDVPMRWKAVLVAALFGAFAAAPCFAQRSFTVGESDISSMELKYYYLSDKVSHDADFTWSFKKDTFTVKKGNVKIPSELSEKLLPERTTDNEITGKWALKNGELLLTEIKGGDKKGRKEVKLSIYKTAPTVVRIGYDAPQYVFVVKP